MRKIILGIVLFTLSFCFGQEIATSESGKKVLLNKNGTYSYIENSQVKKNGTISGVVTYFFNDNYGYKPDIGSKVIIRPILDKDDSYMLISSYTIIKNCKIVLSRKPDEFCSKELKKYNIETEKDFELLCEKIIKHIVHSSFEDNVKELVVNGNGEFKVDLPAGRYEIIVISKNRQSLNLAEATGKIDNEIVNLESDQTINANFEFNKY